MSIRSRQRLADGSIGGDISYELRDALRRNGILEAHIASKDGQLQLVLQGHDSPVMCYNITPRQYEAMADGGTNSSNKLAYKTFTDIVRKDFHMPKDWISAKSVNSSVVMGLHGYRVDEPYGIPRRMPCGRWTMHHPSYLGWTPRHQPGFHGRRIDGHYVPLGGWVAERPGGYMRPGELQSGAYGFYWKGTRPQEQAQKSEDDILGNLKGLSAIPAAPARDTSPAKPYDDLITSVGFTNTLWQEVLSSHGITVDAANKTMTVQGAAESKDTVYYLSDADIQKLTSNDITKVPLEKRLEIINGIIAGDYKEKVTKAMLDSTERLPLHFTDAKAADVRLMEESRQREEQANVIPDPLKEKLPVGWDDGQTGVVRGDALRDVNEAKGWFREGANGREVSVGDIWAQPLVETHRADTIVCKAGGRYNIVELTAADMERLDKGEVDAKTLYEEKIGKPLADGADVKRPEAGTLTKDVNGKWQFHDPPLPQETVGYRMSAMIDGKQVDKEISEKDYNKFMALDDYHRMKLFSKTFDGVEMKTLPQYRMTFGEGLAAVLGVTHGLAMATASIAYDYHDAKRAIEGPHHHHHPEPPAPGVFFKPGVDTPLDVAQRQFDVAMAQHEAGLSHGRGM